jgi:hypothetical protein
MMAVNDAERIIENELDVGVLVGFSISCSRRSAAIRLVSRIGQKALPEDQSRKLIKQVMEAMK